MKKLCAPILLLALWGCEIITDFDRDLIGGDAAVDSSADSSTDSSADTGMQTNGDSGTNGDGGDAG